MTINEPEVRRLLQEIFARLNIADVNEEVRTDPDVYLLSLINTINEHERDASYMTLHMTVQEAAFGYNLEKARKKLRESE